MTREVKSASGHEPERLRYDNRELNRWRTCRTRPTLATLHLFGPVRYPAAGSRCGDNTSRIVVCQRRRCTDQADITALIDVRLRMRKTMCDEKYLRQCEHERKQQRPAKGAGDWMSSGHYRIHYWQFRLKISRNPTTSGPHFYVARHYNSDQ